MVRYWLQHLVGPFIVSLSLVILLAGKKWRVRYRYLISVGAALAITLSTRLMPGSPWLVTVMVSAMVGVCFRYW